MTYTTSEMLNHAEFFICVSQMGELPTPKISALQLIRGLENYDSRFCFKHLWVIHFNFPIVTPSAAHVPGYYGW
jgi:hypothetical protein